MKIAARIVGAAALVATVLPSFLFLGGSMELDTAKTVMLVGAVLWFVAAPIADRPSPIEEAAEEAGQVVVP